MVSSPMYDRLMTFAAQADYNAELQSWDSEHKRVIDGFDEAIERVRHFQEHQGFTGKTGEALKAWADQTSHVWKPSAPTTWAGSLAMLLPVRLLRRPPRMRGVFRRHSSIRKRPQCAMLRR